MSHPTTHKYLNTWKVVVKELRKRENVKKILLPSQILARHALRYSFLTIQKETFLWVFVCASVLM